MDDIFNFLSSSARLDKSKRKKPKAALDSPAATVKGATAVPPVANSSDQVCREQANAFRNVMGIRVVNKQDADLPDPISSFEEISRPPWTKVRDDDDGTFSATRRVLLRNIEHGHWKEPMPIQMQVIPTLMHRRDVVGAAPTGTGKTGAFLIPAILLSRLPSELLDHGDKRPKAQSSKVEKTESIDAGRIRALVVAPSFELAVQIHREAERLGAGLHGGLTVALLSKSNTKQVCTGEFGGKRGIDILVSTPMRLLVSIEQGLRLDGVRLAVLDEADQLLRSSDGQRRKRRAVGSDSDSDSSEDAKRDRSSFVQQMDVILHALPITAVRAMFSATVTTHVREMSETILRRPVDISIAKAGSVGGVNPDIEQELMFVGREEGKLLAIRQIVARGQFRPPVIVFTESQERAQALYGELLYDGIHVDVIHAGRSRSAREAAVIKFRRGVTWVLICTDLMARGVDFLAVNMVINYDLPPSGVTFVHRAGRCGRAGRKGKAITLFTESDFDNLRSIANVMKQSGCNVEEWMLNLKRTTPAKRKPKRMRFDINTTPKYDQERKRRRRQKICHAKQTKLTKTGD